MEQSKLILDLLEELIEAETMGETFAESKTVKPLKRMISNAKKGLKIRDEQPDSNKCCKSPNGKGNSVGLARAHQLANNENLSLKTLKRMKSFGERHMANVNWDDKESKSVQAILLWGLSDNKGDAEDDIAWLGTQINKLEKD